MVRSACSAVDQRAMKASVASTPEFLDDGGVISGAAGDANAPRTPRGSMMEQPGLFDADPAMAPAQGSLFGVGRGGGGAELCA